MVGGFTHRLIMHSILFIVHVGSRSQSPRVYELALKMSAELFEYGYESGYQFNLLDIGGGFPGIRSSKEVFQ